MNPWQMALQLKHLLKQVEWPDGDQDLVLGREVYVSAGAFTEDQLPGGFPFALVSPQGSNADEDHPNVVAQDFQVVLVQMVNGDRMGENSLVGGARKGRATGRSAQRGILELRERVATYIGALSGSDGARIQVSHTSGVAPQYVGDKRHLVFCNINLSARCSENLDHEPVQELTALGGANQVLLTWHPPVERWDYMQTEIVRKDGSTPPADVTDGTVVATKVLGELPTYVDVPGAPGTYSYAAFAGYRMVEGGTVVQARSAPEVGSTRAAVVVT